MPTQDTQAKPVRCRYTPAFKNDLVQRSLQPGASVSGIALENGVNANVLFRWRREHLRASGRMQPHGAARAVLLPVKMAAATPGEPDEEPSGVSAVAGIIEIDIGIARVRLRGAVDEANVRCVLHTLRAIA